MEYLLGIDIGGTHVKGGIVTGTTGKMDQRTIVYEKIDAGGSATSIIKGILRVITALKKGREMKLSVNDILFPPAWWTANEGELGFYHPKKWRKLIELDPIFAIEDAFVGTGVDMTKKSQILREWLNKNIIIDDETGMRIMMDGLVEITDLN